MDTVRIDKWLWAARFFKTRALASRACELGRVQWKEQPAKPARDVKVGDMLRVKNEGGEFEIEVLVVSAARGPAAVAQTFYRETEASKVARARAAAERKETMLLDGPRPAGRPSKRDRRLIHRFRDD